MKVERHTTSWGYLASKTPLGFRRCRAPKQRSVTTVSRHAYPSLEKLMLPHGALQSAALFNFGNESRMVVTGTIFQ